MRSDLDQLSRPGEQVDPQIGPTPAAASIPYPLAAPTADSFAQRTLWHDAWERLAHNRIALAGGFVILMLTVVAVAAPVVAPHDPARQNYERISRPPSVDNLVGTDQLGRDLLSRLIWGARISISVGIFTQLIVLVIGVPIGSIAATFGGRADNLLMRFTDIVYAFPDLLLIILFRAVFGPSIYMMFLAIALANWVGVARLTRGQLLSLKERDFVEAARAIGASNLQLILRHLLPNAVGPLIVLMTFNIPRAIFAEAALSYIGIGIAPPTPSWGSMIQEGGQAIFAAPWQVLVPGLAIAATMMAFTFLGDGLRDALDPRMTRR